MSGQGSKSKRAGKSTERGAPQRVWMTLDARVPREKEVLEKLSAQPRARRGEWLRGLVKRGFAAEKAEESQRATKEA